VQEHHGSITVQSRAQDGTIVTISFPVDEVREVAV